ncbi:SET domain-containing protein [Nemania sp. FL0031]|nr:SET domain-containing protein [Nemania sp. FL0031]
MPTLPEGLVLIGAPGAPRGRGIAATRDFKPGERIATFSSPSIAITTSEHLPVTCSGCLVPVRPPGAGPPPMPVERWSRVARACTGCRTAVYCSPECQKLDWTKGAHKAECKIFNRVRQEGRFALPTPVRAIVQVLLRPDLKAAVAELQAHYEERREGDLRNFTEWSDTELQASGSLHYAGFVQSQENLREAIQILSKLQVNGFSRLDEDVGQSGIFLNAALAMVNHSCTPNAFVQFVGRKAVLHAYQEIKKDEEIEISYIDCNLHRSQRQEELKQRYHFTCKCPRCQDDLDVYQVCRTYPHLSLNKLSAAPDIQKLPESPAAPGILSSNKSLSDTIKEIYPWCSSPLKSSAGAKKAELTRRWAATKPLRDLSTPAYAIAPLPFILAEASIYFGQQDIYEYSLAIACFLATRVDPYKFPAPFAPSRLKGLWMIVKLVASVAPAAPEDAPGAKAEGLRGEIYKLLATRIDHTLWCQLLLKFIVRYGPSAHSSHWTVLQEAKSMMDDLDDLPNREKENEYVEAIMRDPDEIGEGEFFRLAVVKPLQELSDFCLDIMDQEFSV